MIKKYNSSLWVLLFIVMVWGVPFISSCGKTTTANPSLNVQYQIINLSPDLQAVDLYIKFIKVTSTGSFYYPTSSGYFLLPSTDTPFQIRTAQSLIPGNTTPVTNLFNLDNILKSNLKYTLFITGLKRDSTLGTVFVTDTAAVPTIGRGKVRFINASPGSQGLDIYANGTLAFSNAKFSSVSKFIELPAGTYDFKIFPAGSTSNQIQDIPNTIILDGRLYNFYSYGLPGHTTDSLSFGSNMIIVPPLVK